MSEDNDKNAPEDVHPPPEGTPRKQEGPPEGPGVHLIEGDGTRGDGAEAAVQLAETEGEGEGLQEVLAGNTGPEYAYQGPQAVIEDSGELVAGDGEQQLPPGEPVEDQNLQGDPVLTTLLTEEGGQNETEMKKNRGTGKPAEIEEQIFDEEGNMVETVTKIIQSPTRAQPGALIDVLGPSGPRSTPAEVDIVDGEKEQRIEELKQEMNDLYKPFDLENDEGMNDLYNNPLIWRMMKVNCFNDL